LAIIREKRLRRLVQRHEPLLQQLVANEFWSMDFMSDGLLDESKELILYFIDDYG
jgi:hypothetical protein